MVAVIQAKYISMLAWDDTKKDGKKYEASVDLLKEHLTGPPVALINADEKREALRIIPRLFTLHLGS